MGYLPTLIDPSNPTQGLDWAIMIAPVISGALSFFCSALMVFRFIKHRRKAATKVKERLLAGLSVGDMIFSAACAMSTFAGPAYLQDFIDDSWVRHQVVKGNDATCNLQGWLYQIGIAPPLYTACLSVYYYLAICRRKRDREILKCIEPTMHVVVWIWALVTASLGLGLKLVVYIGFGGCRVSSTSDFTQRCKYDPTLPECTNPNKIGAWLLFSFGLPPLAISIVVILVMMTLIYRQVSIVEKKGNRWNFGSALMAMARRRQTETVRMSSIPPPSAYLSNNASAFMADAAGVGAEETEGVKAPDNLKGGYAPSVGSALSEESKITEMAPPANEEETGPASAGAGSIANGCSLPPSQISGRPSSGAASLASSVYSQNSKISGRSSSAFSGDSQLSGVEEGESRKLRRKRKKEENKLSNRVKDTGIQYIVGFFVCYAIPIINISNSEPDPLLMLLLGGITLPAQGIWNFVFYTRDRMKSIRKRNPDQPWRERLGEAVFGFE